MEIIKSVSSTKTQGVKDQKSGMGTAKAIQHKLRLLKDRCKELHEDMGSSLATALTDPARSTSNVTAAAAAAKAVAPSPAIEEPVTEVMAVGLFDEPAAPEAALLPEAAADLAVPAVAAELAALEVAAATAEAVADIGAAAADGDSIVTITVDPVHTKIQEVAVAPTVEAAGEVMSAGDA